jgi:hypothetical protein
MTTRQSQKNPVLMFIKRLNYDVFLILRGSQQATKCHPSSGLSLCEANGIIGQAWNRCRRLCIFNRYCNAHCSGHNCSQGRSSLASGVPCLSDGPAYTTRMGGRGHPRHRRMSNDISYCKPDKSTPSGNPILPRACWTLYHIQFLGLFRSIRRPGSFRRGRHYASRIPAGPTPTSQF